MSLTFKPGRKRMVSHQVITEIQQVRLRKVGGWTSRALAMAMCVRTAVTPHLIAWAQTCDDVWAFDNGDRVGWRGCSQPSVAALRRLRQ